MEFDPAAANTPAHLSRPQPVRYKQVEFSADYLSEGAQMRIPSADIRSISLSWGNVAERLVAQILFGLVMTGVGLFCTWCLYMKVVYGAHLPSHLCAASVVTILGIYALKSALRRGYFLRVQTDREVRKVVFAEGADPEQIERFLKEAKRTFGYPISSELDHSRAPYR